ncbi:hypothetical protein RFI_13677 [Reticulomyxa filosa]|uniref:Uncharacterized protein n=1 Tax=Reticulomyxa filosa TaxID=46433 RepID=X6NCL1_RETFI|nr:hypothetical protein RFI_13677 [Reticulomyxa filosa]|eukprot:ETO23499.1 hypothetical protein RFI_13677 [Reticulomyxa filosa]
MATSGEKDNASSQIVEEKKEEKKGEASSEKSVSHWRCSCGILNEMKQWSLSKTMKGLIKASTTEGYEYKEMNVPEPREGELLIQSFSVGISAIDIDLFKGRSNLVAADQIALFLAMKLLE